MSHRERGPKAGWDVEPFFVVLSGFALIAAVILGTATGIFSASAEDRAAGSDPAPLARFSDAVPQTSATVLPGGEARTSEGRPAGEARSSGDHIIWVSTGGNKTLSP